MERDCKRKYVAKCFALYILRVASFKDPLFFFLREAVTNMLQCAFSFNHMKHRMMKMLYSLTYWGLLSSETYWFLLSLWSIIYFPLFPLDINRKYEIIKMLYSLMHWLLLSSQAILFSFSICKESRRCNVREWNMFASFFSGNIYFLCFSVLTLTFTQRPHAFFAQSMKKAPSAVIENFIFWLHPPQKLFILYCVGCSSLKRPTLVYTQSMKKATAAVF